MRCQLWQARGSSQVKERDQAPPEETLAAPREPQSQSAEARSIRDSSVTEARPGSHSKHEREAMAWLTPSAVLDSLPS